MVRVNLNYYQILGLYPSATQKEIKQAYRKLSIKFHPDKNPDDDGFFKQKFQEINEAYSVLSDLDKRKEYDNSINTDTIYEKYKEEEVEKEVEKGLDVSLKFLIFTNIGIYILIALIGGSFFELDSETLFNCGALHNGIFYYGDIWRLISSQFLHLHLQHLVLNMYCLYMIGNSLLTFINKKIFVIVYITTGIFAGIASALFGKYNISVGASGAIFGIAGFYFALLYLFKRDNVFLDNNEIIVEQCKSIGIFIGINLVVGFIYPGVDNLAHLGGLISGIFIGIIYNNYYLNYKNKKSSSNEELNLEGIRGWLIVFAAHQIFLLLTSLFTLYLISLNGFGLSKEIIKNLALKHTIDEIVYFHNLSVTEDILICIEIFLVFIAFYLFINKKRYFIHLFSIRSLYTITIIYFLEKRGSEFATTLGPFFIIGTIIYAMIYMIYFYTSHRVKSTFIN